MRPVLPVEGRRLAYEPEPGADVVPALIDSLGPYCSICERPLLEEAFAWEPGTGTLVSPYRVEPPAADCLPLCATCASAQAERQDDPAGLELPDSAVLVLPDAPGSGVVLPDERSGGYFYDRDGSVVAHGDAAARTVDYFQLDGPPWADPRARLRGQVSVLASGAVSRLDHRSEEWVWLPQLVATTGFLSVWLTAVARWGGPDLLEEFVRRALDSVPMFFPGTDWDRMVPPSELMV